jgi:hypothetical protein
LFFFRARVCAQLKRFAKYLIGGGDIRVRVFARVRVSQTQTKAERGKAFQTKSVRVSKKVALIAQNATW